MTKTQTKIFATLAGILTALAILAIFALAVGAYADTQDLRDRGTTGRTVDLTPSPAPVPAPVPAPTPTPPPTQPSGGITSVTVGSVDTGGNLGGNVTTGNEHVEVFEINIGPTNPPPPPSTDSTGSQQAGGGQATPPAPDCDGRTRTGCDTSGRTR